MSGKTSPLKKNRNKNSFHTVLINQIDDTSCNQKGRKKENSCHALCVWISIFPLGKEEDYANLMSNLLKEVSQRALSKFRNSSLYMRDIETGIFFASVKNKEDCGWRSDRPPLKYKEWKIVLTSSVILKREQCVLGTECSLRPWVN